MELVELCWGRSPARSLIASLALVQVFTRPLSAFNVTMTKLGFLRLSYEKQDTLLKLLILSMAAVLCESASEHMGWLRGLWGGTASFLLLFFHRSSSSRLSLKRDFSERCDSFSICSLKTVAFQ